MPTTSKYTPYQLYKRSWVRPESCELALTNVIGRPWEPNKYLIEKWYNDQSPLVDVLNSFQHCFISSASLRFSNIRSKLVPVKQMVILLPDICGANIRFEAQAVSWLPYYLNNNLASMVSSNLVTLPAMGASANDNPITLFSIWLSLEQFFEKGRNIFFPSNG